MRIKKFLIGIVSALCAMTCFAGSGISVFAEEDLTTTINIYVSDNDGMPADGTHTFIMIDGSNQLKAQNYGNTASFTVTLPVGQDIKTVVIYEEQSNPAGYVYDQSVYGISLVSNYDHTMLDAVDITKDGVEYAGNIFFANMINTATPTPEVAIDPATGLPIDPNAAENAETAVQDNTIYEREHVVYGKAVSMDAQSTTIRDANDVEHIVFDNNVHIVNKFNLNDDIVLAYNGTADNMIDAVIGKDLKVEIIESSEPEISEDTPRETVKPEATEKPEEETEELKEPVVNEKKSGSKTWIYVVIGAGVLALAMIIGILIGSKPLPVNNEPTPEPKQESDEEDFEYEEIPEEEDEDSDNEELFDDDSEDDQNKVEFINADKEPEAVDGEENE